MIDLGDKQERELFFEGGFGENTPFDKCFSILCLNIISRRVPDEGVQAAQEATEDQVNFHGLSFPLQTVFLLQGELDSNTLFFLPPSGPWLRKRRAAAAAEGGEREGGGGRRRGAAEAGRHSNLTW